MDNDNDHNNEAIEAYKPELPTTTLPSSAGQSQPSQNPFASSQSQNNASPDPGNVSTNKTDIFGKVMAFAHENHTLVVVALALIVLIEVVWGYSFINSTNKKIAQREAAKVTTNAPVAGPTLSIQMAQ